MWGKGDTFEKVFPFPHTPIPFQSFLIAKKMGVVECIFAAHEGDELFPFELSVIFMTSEYYI